MTKPSREGSVITRREAIQRAGGALLLAGCGGGLDLGLAPTADFDAVLDGLSTSDPELSGGTTNHAPMAAEALVALGHPERVVPFVEAYEGQLRPMPVGAALSPDERATALGDLDRRADWIATYEAELATADVRAVVACDFAMLAPGVAAAGFHGLLRLGHGVRSFDRADTASRRRELAHGLGYFFATHVTLPGTPGAAAEAGFDVVSAFAALPIVPRDRQISGGLIVDRLAPATDNPAFAALVERVDLDALPFDQALTEICAATARVFVADGGSSFSLLHTITGPAALRLVSPWLDDANKRLGLGYVFQMAAAVVSAQGGAPPPVTVDAPTLSVDQIRSQAAASNDDHVVKLGEAALREHAIEPRPELLRAAELWLG